MSESLRVLPFPAPLGAELVGLDWRQPVSEADMPAVLQAWARHLVLLFRGPAADDAQLIAFSRRFGELDLCPPNDLGRTHIEAHPEIVVISNAMRDGRRIGSLGNGESIWHTDMSYVAQPPKASLLHALEIPPAGGDTQFCNMYLALESMPADLRRQLQGATVVHDESRDSAGQLRKGWAPVTDPRQAPGARHPMIRIHPDTGRAALFLGRRRNAYVLGHSLEDSEALLDRVWAHATRPEFAWRHHWRAGDLVLWDNRCTMHRRDAFDPSTTRIMHRTQVHGEPVRAPADWHQAAAT
ncbi:MAG: TauD/TfdA dioxygenase family protein [Burkholderiaceae bacterium]